ncbi:MAG: SMC-Scp complex subunit ScpB [Promethearchaeia archaeon]
MLQAKDQLEKLSTDEEHFQRLKDAEFKKKIEAILFAAHEIVPIKELRDQLPELSKQKVIKLTRDLIQDYRSYNTSLEVVELSDYRFQLKIKDKIVNSIDKFIHGKLLRPSAVKTLAVIIFLQPSATRKNLYKKRGRSSTVYRNIRTLIEYDFIKEVDRTFYLTQTFYDYFQLKNKDPHKAKEILQKFLERVQK